MADSDERSPQMVERRSGKEAAEERPLWLPEGWTVETTSTTTTTTKKKTMESGIEEEDVVVCFVDPSTGSRFYSKDEVLEFILAENPRDPADKENTTAPKASADAKPIREEVELTEITEGELKGFFKEVKYRMSRGKLKKDTFYHCRRSGYVIFSKEDALRYVNSGGIHKCVVKPKRSTIVGTQSAEAEPNRPAAENEPEPAGNATKRHLFTEATPVLKVPKIEIDDSPRGLLVPPSNQPSPQGVGQADPVNKSPSNPQQFKNQNYNKSPLGLKLTLDDGLYELVRTRLAIQQTQSGASTQHMQPDLADESLPKTSETETISVAEGIEPSEEVPKNPKNLEQSQPKKRGRKPKRGSRKAKAATEVKQAAQPKRRKTKAARDISIPLRASERLATLRARNVANAGPAGQSSDAKFKLSNQPGAKSSQNFYPDSESNNLVSDKQKENVIINLEIPKKLESEKILGKEASLEKPEIGVEVPKKLESKELLAKEAGKPLAKEATPEKTIAGAGNPANLKSKELLGKEAKGPFAKDAISEKLIKGVEIRGKLENQELLGKAAMEPPAKQTVVEMSMIGRPIIEKLESKEIVGEAAAVKPLAIEAAPKQPTIGKGVPEDNLESKELLGKAAAVKPLAIEFAPGKLLIGIGIPVDKAENKEHLGKGAAVKPLAIEAVQEKCIIGIEIPKDKLKSKKLLGKAAPKEATIGTEVPENQKSMELLGKEPIPGKQIERSAPTADTPALSLTSPLGYLWPDPCIEFAFKTLTGDIPLDNTTSFADYVNHQVDTEKKASLDSTASAHNNNTKNTTTDERVDQQGPSGKRVCDVRDREGRAHG